MTKVALLIGVSEYGLGLNPLPGAVRDVEAMHKALQPLEMGGFDQIKQLVNPNPPVMREAIAKLFSGRTQDDLVLLFFSGHMIEDDSGQLYFATSITSKSPKAKLIRVSAIPVSFVQDKMNNSPCERQVVIVDCCFSRASAQEITANNDGTVDIKTQLSGEGRAILTSFTSTQNFFKSKDFGTSIYTRYLVEGLRTGVADGDSDGWIAVDELHEYASNKVQVVAPAFKPEFYPVEDGSKILLFLAPINDPKLKYRKEAERWVSRGEISEAGRYVLNKLQKSLDLTSKDCTEIEAEALRPYQDYQESLQHYKQKFAKAMSNGSPLGTQQREELRSLQQSLGLKDEDVAPIEEPRAVNLANLPASEHETDELAESDAESVLNPVPSPSVVMPEYLPISALTPTDSTSTSDNKAAQSTPSDTESKLNAVPSTPSVVRPEYSPIPTLEPTNLTPTVNLPSRWTSSETESSSAGTFANKFLLLIGIGGALATLAFAISFFTRKPVTPPAPQANKASSSPKPSVTPSPTPTQPENTPTPSPSVSPESSVCTVFINGNLRSEPAPFRNNVVEALKEPLPITGKQTKGGWVEVKLPNSQLVWAHPNVILSNTKEMDDCLSRKGITIRTIEDMLPPASSSSP
jgi:hypothetical protein